ncbi:tRNA (guanine(9)-N(1))-methyltransferase [Spiromyces aspiralis]|uniref:tRNA (Guanine(9)-N(1))-methyltransferase n=1 Tax=Spiromyces aspiralis TaxID=68401 RepID=A0ACC1HE98_9FUNG|nr:tRNA (guanine(9)-N(1))-methyltransferase [Spiromyces aspiralis]
MTDQDTERAPAAGGSPQSREPVEAGQGDAEADAGIEVASATEASFDPFQKNISVDNYVPRSMSFDEFRKLSRNAKKKVMKSEIWEMKKPALDKLRKEKAKAYRARRRERIMRGELDNRQKRPATQRPSNLTVIFDMGFDNKMLDHEVTSMAKQVQLSYAANRVAQYYTSLQVTHFDGRLKELLETRYCGFKSWDSKYIQFHAEDYLDLFPHEKLVYLTADSPNKLETLDPEKYYIVGGIVDKNRYPNLTLHKASEQGIAHGRLPIGDFIHMKSRKVLTVNQVYDIILAYLDCHDWKRAFVSIIPDRKLRERDAIGDSSDEDVGKDSDDNGDPKQQQ